MILPRRQNCDEQAAVGKWRRPGEAACKATAKFDDATNFNFFLPSQLRSLLTQGRGVTKVLYSFNMMNQSMQHNVNDPCSPFDRTK